MAKFWTKEQIPKHKDEIPKRKITSEDIIFFKDLQKELNTQNTCGTADPRYWVIREPKTYPTKDDWADDYRIYAPDLADDFTIKEFFEHFNEMKYENFPYTLKYEKSDIYNENLSLYEDDELIEEDLYEVIDKINNHIMSDYEVIPVMIRDESVRDLIFLTQEDATNYLKRKAHNHHKEARTYCMCNGGDPRYEKLIKMLRTIDFDNIKIE